MKCKKSIMGFAALLILIFHFYIPFGKSGLETFFYRAAYIGVDLFFFVSANSLGRVDKIDFGPFIVSRISRVYVPFVIMAAIATVYKHWNLKRFVNILVGKEFYDKGGGAFLWFVIAIMIFYLLSPIFIKLKNRFGLFALLILTLGWCLTAIIFQYGLGNKNVFIAINRIPVFVLGLFYDEYRKLDLKKIRIPVAIVELFLGCFLVYRWGTSVRLLKPFADMYYILAIPMVLGIAKVFDAMSEIVKIRNIPFAYIGRITLELYGIQMIFGYDIESRILKLTQNGMVAFLSTVVVLVTMATFFSYMLKGLRLLVNMLRAKVK